MSYSDVDTADRVVEAIAVTKAAEDAVKVAEANGAQDEIEAYVKGAKKATQAKLAADLKAATAKADAKVAEVKRIGNAARFAAIGNLSLGDKRLFIDTSQNFDVFLNSPRTAKKEKR